MIRSFRKAPTDYYCQSLSPVDEQLCALIAERKALSQNNPGFPPEEWITSRCEQYGLNKDMMWGIFSSLHHEHHFQPMVEPTGFLKFLSVLKTVEANQVMYTVTHLKQYTNASVVMVEIELVAGDSCGGIGHASLRLDISPEYQCRPADGCSQGNGMQYSFVVTPPLPDNLDGTEFNLTIEPFPDVPEFRRFFTEKVAVTVK